MAGGGGTLFRPHPAVFLSSFKQSVHMSFSSVSLSLSLLIFATTPAYSRAPLEPVETKGLVQGH